MAAAKLSSLLWVALLGCMLAGAPAFAAAACTGSPVTVNIPALVAQTLADCPNSARCRQYAAMYLAMHHVNTLNATVVGEDTMQPLRSINCTASLTFVPSLMDTQDSPTLASRELLQLSSGKNFTVLLGGASSSVVAPLATISAAFDTLTLADSSTSVSLASPQAYPLLARMLPSDSAAARSLLNLAKHFEWKTVCLLVVDDIYGTSVAAEMTALAKTYGLSIPLVATYSRTGRVWAGTSLYSALAEIKASGIRVVVTTSFDTEVEALLEATDALGLATGPRSLTFVFTDALSSPVAGADSPTYVSEHLAGMLRLNPVKANDSPGSRWSRLGEAWKGIPSSALPSRLAQYASTFRGLPVDTAVLGSAYDAVWAIAIAAAKHVARGGPSALDITAQALFDQLSNSSFSFQGTTDTVAFTSAGERRAELVIMGVESFVHVAGSTGSFQAVGTATSTAISISSPITWHDGSTAVPSDGVTCAARHVYDPDIGVCAPRVGLMVPVVDASGALLAPFTQQHRAAALLAVRMALARNGSVVPAFSSLRPAVVSPVVLETHRTTAGSVSQAMEAVSVGRGVVSFLGAIPSGITAALSPVAYAAQVPTTSASSTSSALNDKSTHPFLSRTVVDDGFTATFIADTLLKYNISSVGVIATDDSYGTSFVGDFSAHAVDINITIMATSFFHPGDQKTVADAVKVAARSGARAFLLIALNDAGDAFIAAHALGVTGKGYAWIVADGVRPSALHAAGAPPDMGEVLHGVMRIVPVAVPPGGLLSSFHKVWSAQNASSPEWLGLQDGLGIPAANRISQQTFSDALDTYTPYVFDTAVMHILAINRTAHPEQGSVLQAEITMTSFTGITGTVELDPVTKDRKRATASVEVMSWRYDAATHNIKEVPIATWGSDGSFTKHLPVVWPGNITSNIEFSACQAGWEFDVVELRCKPCGLGSAATGFGGSCEPCAAGSFAHTLAMTECIYCTALRGYASAPGSVSCEHCPARSELVDGAQGVGIADCTCVRGAYHKPSSPRYDCLPCPSGAACPGGDELPIPLAGYYRFFPRSAVMHKCELEDACLGAPPDQAELGSDTINSSTIVVGCAEGYTGPLCGVCAPGHGRGISGKCETCRTPVLTVIVGVGTFLVIVGIILFLLRHAIKSRGRVSPVATLRKILLSHFQVMGIVTSVELNWPDAVQSMFDVYSVLGNPASDSLIQAGCIVSPNEAEWRIVDITLMFLTFSFALTFIIVAIELSGLGKFCLRRCTVRLWCKACCRRCRRGSKQDSVTSLTLPLDARRSRGVGKLGYTLLCLIIVAYTLHPFLTRRNMLLFQCTEYSTAELTGVDSIPHTFSILQSDRSVDCSSSDWLLVQLAMGVPMLLLIVVGIPVWLLYQLRQRLRHSVVSYRTKAVFGFLFLGFKREAYFWEVVVMARKALIALVTVYASTEMQIITMTFILAVALVAHQALKPYVYPAVNAVETASLATQVITLICGAYYFEGTGASEGVRVMVGILIVALNLAFFLLWCFITYGELQAMRKGAQLRTAYSSRDNVMAFIQGMMSSLNSRRMPGAPPVRPKLTAAQSVQSMLSAAPMHAQMTPESQAPPLAWADGDDDEEDDGTEEEEEGYGDDVSFVERS